MSRKCCICVNYNHNDENCSNCNFEYDEDLPWTDDGRWDILDINDDIEWAHLQIMYRLKAKNIDCLWADIWVSDLAYIQGVTAGQSRVADALGIHKECVYCDYEHSFYILNLFQEKCLRLSERLDLC